MARERRGVVTAVLVAGALASACSGEPAATVVDEDTALQAVAESFAGSWAWSGRLEVVLSDAQVDSVVELGGGGAFGADDDAVERQVRLALDELGRQRMHGALGDDASFRAAWQRDETDLVDVRLDIGEVVRAESMTPDASIVTAVDAPALLAWFRDMQEVIDSFGLFEVPTVDELREDVRRFIDDADLRRVVLAVLDGGFGGVTGTLDFEELGVTEEQLGTVREAFAEQLIGLADAATFRELAAEALTVRDVTSEAGVTRAVVDLHPRAAADAVDDLFDDARGLAGDLGDDALADEELPDTLSSVAQLSFDAAGHLVEVRTDVLAIAGQLAPVMRLDAESARLLTRLQGATVHVVFGFEDHDEVATVADVAATTMPWDGIADYFRPEVEDAVGDAG